MAQVSTTQTTLERSRQMVQRFHSMQPVSERRLIPNQMPFIDQAKYGLMMERLLANATSDEDKKAVKEFVGRPIFELANIESWNEERVPRPLRHIIRTATDELIFRAETFLECVEPSFFKSIPDYLSDPFAQKEFKGIAISVDQSNSSADQRGSDPQTIKKTTDVMHLYFMVSMSVFRLWRDVLVGDAISLNGKAPEDNATVVAIEAARFLLTMQTIFRIHNKMVDLSPTGQYSHIRIRGAAGSGQIGVNDNPIQPTVICDLMNFVARIAGYLPEMGILVNNEAGEHIKPYFKLREIQVGNDIVEEVTKAKKESEGLWKNRKRLGREQLASLYERYYALLRKLDILHITYERKNMQDPQKVNGEEQEEFEKRRAAFWAANKERFLKECPFLAQKAEYTRRLEELGGLMYAKGADAGAEIADIKLGVEFALGAQEYIQMLGKFKGFRHEDIGSLWEILSYVSAQEDMLAFPENSRFRRMYMDEGSRGRDRHKCKLEEFVEDTAERYGFPAKTDFNLEGAYYIMYTMQLTGSPDFAFQTAVRAAGTAIYMVNQMAINFGNQPNKYMQAAEKVFVTSGVLGKGGEIDEDKMKAFVEKQIILPSMLREIGILEVYNKINEEALKKARERKNAQEELLKGVLADPLFNAEELVSELRDTILKRTRRTSVLDDKSSQLGATAALLAKPFSDFTSEEELRARDIILKINLLSASMLTQLNERYGAKTVPEETIAVISRLTFGKPRNGNGAHELQLEDIAADIIKPSCVEQAGLKPKAYKRRKEALPPYTRRDMLRKTRALEPNVLAAMEDLIYFEEPG